ncbi:MAG TPA: MFS transporter [Ilumatobacteraceae bacterium]|nr:MFS transporter [Ilumatobacteraceae bacterium]
MTGPTGIAAGSARLALRSVFVVFTLPGVAIASLLSRVPQIRDALELDPGELGVVLLMTAVGSLLSLPASGVVVHRLGARRTVAIMSVVSMMGLGLVAIGSEVSPAVVGAGLFVFGFGAGQWDVAMNVEGVAVEQLLERSIMSRFHAAFSLGTVVGALIGAAMNALDVPPLPHLLAVSGIVLLVVQFGVRGFIPAADDEVGDHATVAARSPLEAWTEPRTVMIGVFVLCTTFAEGTGNDWIGVATIDGYGASDAMGSVAYVMFVTSMTLGRWFGPALLDRRGRVTVLRAASLCTLVGVLIVVFGPSLATALIGVVIWGAGTALGFPTGMSAAADDPLHAAGRVSAVATIGYIAFLAGPSLIGLIGDHTGVLRALTVTAALAAVAAAVAGSTRPLPRSDDPVSTTMTTTRD